MDYSSASPSGTTSAQHEATQAAERLNEAFRALENRIGHLQQQATAHPEQEILEQENQQLHEALMVEQNENVRLKEVVRHLSLQLEQTIGRVEKLMEMADA